MSMWPFNSAPVVVNADNDLITISFRKDWLAHGPGDGLLRLLNERGDTASFVLNPDNAGGIAREAETAIMLQQK